ncbi:MAG: helix-turn-helix domain-containing protein [Planctomycetes bacterium]|nr:helix-turn-helix domain-containing protein [Planctomycetota bacterium]
MSVVVKARHTDRVKLRISGRRIPSQLVRELGKIYPHDRIERVEDGDDDELIDIASTAWYREMEKSMTPAKALRLYRKNRGLTQEALAKLIGGGTRLQHVSNMENGSRAISLNTARKLARIFGCPVARFV